MHMSKPLQPCPHCNAVADQDAGLSQNHVDSEICNACMQKAVHAWRLTFLFNSSELIQLMQVEC